MQDANVLQKEDVDTTDGDHKRRDVDRGAKPSLPHRWLYTGKLESVEAD
jgi:hypothetical protein